MFQSSKCLCGLTVAILAVAAGCGTGDSSRPAGPESASVPVASSAATSPSDQSPTAASPSPTTHSSPSSRPRTTAELRTGLLSLKDVPPGFEIDKAADDDGGTMTSTKGACAPLVRLMNAAKLPGSKTQAEISFSGGQDGPFVDEDLDAMGTKHAAGAFIAHYRRAVKTCRSVTVRLPGAGSSKMDVREISFGRIGDDTFAARFRAAGGKLEGLEMIQAGVQSGDVVVGMTFVGLDGSDAEAATQDAVKKVEQRLGTSGSI